ncbi:SDR family oxidoreductase [Actinocrinis puniceicyclus]|uniref:SDR family oxidoreductase n=1 Tax=Actinocrinis puniceicyclus TaxID=977794 RepID=A0A8J7WM72_9ACTN|nr:SDR family oxidoreductase [Actinocrinis puniceicyclus]MBS2962354.1 SDR family oxidoreductase [Actinocrinis puniceicyclus]
MAAGVLDGVWSLILGVSGGMGRGCALALAEQGSNILGVHLDTAAGQSAADELERQLRGLGVQTRFFNENAASDRSRAKIIAEAAGLVGPAGVRVFMHSLAFGSLVPFLPGPDGDGDEPHATRAQMDMTLTVMAHSLVYWTQDLLAAGLLGAGAKIFAMTSAGTARVTRSYGMVSAAKCALESHVRQLAVELAPRAVSVNAIRAGITLTESFLRIPESGELSERARLGNPHGRLTTEQDVAEAVVLLAQARSSWLTGNVIGVDGGEILTV